MHLELFGRKLFGECRWFAPLIFNCHVFAMPLHYLRTAWILPPAPAGASSSGTCICHRCGDGAVHDAGGAICRSTCRNAGCKCASCCRAGLHIVVADVWLGFKVFIKSWNLNLLLGGPWVAPGWPA